MAGELTEHIITSYKFASHRIPIKHDRQNHGFNNDIAKQLKKKQRPNRKYNKQKQPKYKRKNKSDRNII